VHFVIDDWGAYNAGYKGNGEAQTPNIDNLVLNGVILERLYSFKFCSPSRSALQSGRDPHHVNVLNIDADIFNASDPVSGFYGIPKPMTGLAEHLQRGGYYTAAVGKWDCGCQTFSHLPAGRGYNESLTYLEHVNDYWNSQLVTGPANILNCSKFGAPDTLVDLWDTLGPAIGKNNPRACNQKSQDDPELNCVFEDALFLNRSLSIIARHDPTHPLFLFHASHAMHDPGEVPLPFLKRFSKVSDPTRALFLALASYADYVLGELVGALKARGMWENTLLVVHADNGGIVSTGNNFPLRGGKYSNWEGGVRVNGFISGGALPPTQRGTVRNGLVALSDFYATYASIAGVDPTDHRASAFDLPPIDGVDQSDYLLGVNSTSPRNSLVLGSQEDPSDGAEIASEGTFIQGIIIPPYKLLIGNLSMSGWSGPQSPNSTQPALGIHPCGDPAVKTGQGCLFDIFADPTEHEDLAGNASFKGVVSALRARITEEQSRVFQPLRGVRQIGEFCAGQVQWQGFLGPFLS